MFADFFDFWYAMPIGNNIKDIQDDLEVGGDNKLSMSSFYRAIFEFSNDHSFLWKAI